MSYFSGYIQEFFLYLVFRSPIKMFLGLSLFFYFFLFWVHSASWIWRFRSFYNLDAFTQYFSGLTSCPSPSWTLKSWKLAILLWVSKAWFTFSVYISPFLVLYNIDKIFIDKNASNCNYQHAWKIWKKFHQRIRNIGQRNRTYKVVPNGNFRTEKIY